MEIRISQGHPRDYESIDTARAEAHRGHVSCDQNAGFKRAEGFAPPPLTERGSAQSKTDYPQPLSQEEFHHAGIKREAPGEFAPTKSEPAQQQKICLADQSEEFSLAVPSTNQSEPKLLRFTRESLRALMNRGDADLVFEQYYQGYSACFTDPNEVESREALRDLLEIGKGDWDISVVTCGDRIVAGYHTKLARISSFSLGLFSVGDYLWTDKSVRGLGVGQFLYDRTMEFRQSQGAQGHFGEIRDVNLLPQKELLRDWRAGTTSQQRIGFWKKQRRMVLDAPWIQPALGEGKSEIDFYMLTLSGLSDSCPRVFPSEAYLELWQKFYPLHKDSPTLETLRQQLADTSAIKLLYIDEPRTYIKAVRSSEVER